MTCVWHAVLKKALHSIVPLFSLLSWDIGVWGVGRHFLFHGADLLETFPTYFSVTLLCLSVGPAPSLLSRLSVGGWWNLLLSAIHSR